MTLWSPPPPPSEARTLTFFACAAATIACTSDVLPREVPQSLFPETVAKARFRCVSLVKSIFVAQLAKLPLQLSRYMTALVVGTAIGPASGAPASVPTLPPASSPASGVVLPESVGVTTPPASVAGLPPSGVTPLGASTEPCAPPSDGVAFPPPLEPPPHARNRGTGRIARVRRTDWTRMA